MGSVQVLTEVLSLAAPAAFNRANQLKAYVAHMVRGLEIEDGWKYEVAAMLSQLGCITLPPDTLERAFAGQAISEQEQEMLAEHPVIGHRLLAHIPRLEPVAQMILGQPVSAIDPEFLSPGRFQQA